VIGLYELLVNPTTLLIEPPWPNARKGKKGRTIRVKDVRTGKGQESIHKVNNVSLDYASITGDMVIHVAEIHTCVH
jgi:hypothetical protein